MLSLGRSGDESEDENQPRILIPLNHSWRPDPTSVHVVRATTAMGRGRDGVWTGSLFHAPESPAFTFASRLAHSVRIVGRRFMIRRRFVPQLTVLKTMMVYTDGACLNNGSVANIPRGGCSIVFSDSPSGTVSFPLEKEGPDGKIYAHTSNRAELRAVIAALGFRAWHGEGWERIVIVTDSEYVCKGATKWLRDWARRGWHTASHKKPANLDLWVALSEVMGTLAMNGCEVSFWMVPRELNTLADIAAKAAAEKEGNEVYAEIQGLLM
ncbi:ribonuclease H-like domain-containing protein [Hypoxylon sp. NC1633]|nr:ribonuclease H-like domain-containing protein [Hypoxylon sp. NC1633]